MYAPVGTCMQRSNVPPHAEPSRAGGRACETCGASDTPSPSMRSSACAACLASFPFLQALPPGLGKHPRSEPLHNCASCVHTSIPSPDTPGTFPGGIATFSLPTEAHPATPLRGVVAPDALVAVVPPCLCSEGRHVPANVSARQSLHDCFHTCHCGAPWSTDNPVANARESVLFTETEPQTVKMYSLRCSRKGCDCLLPYDGSGQGIFVYSARVAIRESMLVNAMVQLSQGSTFDAIATQWQTIYKFCNKDVAYALLPQRWLLRLLIRSYLQLLPDTDTVCPCCGFHPLTLIADGTALGCKLALGKKHLHADGRTPLPSGDAEIYGAPSETYHFIHEAAGSRKHRELLYRCILPPRLVDGRPAPGAAEKLLPGVTQSEFKDLLTWCESRTGKSRVVFQRLSSLAAVLRHVSTLPGALDSDSRFLCPESWAHFLQPLIVPSATWLCFEPTEQLFVLRALLEPNALSGSSASAPLRARAILACPFLVDFFDATGFTSFPPQSIPLVNELCNMATALVLLADEPRFSVPAISASPLTLSQLQTRVSDLSAFATAAEQSSPASADAVAARSRANAASAALVRVTAASVFEPTTLSEDRAQGIWASPGYRQRRAGRFAYRAKDDRADLCSKDVPDSGAFTPGLLILACPHGYIYYIQFMRGGESPAMVLDFLRDRCRPENLPVRLCYDNGCNLQAYVLARCPDIAGRVQFIIDRLHSRNHKHCSIAFQLDRFTHHASQLNFNTQRVEQLNRMLRKLATHLRFSRPDHGIDTLRVFMMLFSFQHQSDSAVISAADAVPDALPESDEPVSLDEDMAALALSELAAAGAYGGR